MRLKCIGVALYLGAMAGLSGCNTVEGVGRDVQSIGRTVEETAR